jgi:hypothetical protein
MTKTEQAAFVKAYGQNVAHHSDVYVADFVARYVAGEDIDYSHEQISIIDALGMWHCAIQYQLQNQKG